MVAPGGHGVHGHPQISEIARDMSEVCEKLWTDELLSFICLKIQLKTNTKKKKKVKSNKKMSSEYQFCYGYSASAEMKF